ncbi:MAG: hypothetical protein HYR96_16315 [Deltaproteobacteria bacterium]|nr:hypothetical protein [Deltaproteobacteria bacterium]MBI3296391.1 hypothetical protein [Deltaproteobacteria bacterium]
MKTLTHLFGLLAAVLLSACSIDTANCTDVNQDKIYQSYSASYDTKEDETSTRAQFRLAGVTGTTLKMDGKCNIKVDSMDLSASTLLGTAYNGSKSGYTAANTFTFTDNNSKDFVNKIENKNTVALSSPPSSVSRASGVTINFTPAITADESVTVYITYAASQSTAKSSTALKSTSASGATSVSFSSSELSDLSVDAAVEIYATRTYSKSLDQAAASQGGSMSYDYTSAHASSSVGS